MNTNDHATRELGRVFFAGCECVVCLETGVHTDDTPGRRIQLYSADELREPVATATMHVTGAVLGDEDFVIKSYSENKGIVDVLQAAGILGSPTSYITLPFVVVPVCPLLV